MSERKMSLPFESNVFALMWLSVIEYTGWNLGAWSMLAANNNHNIRQDFWDAS